VEIKATSTRTFLSASTGIDSGKEGEKKEERRKGKEEQREEEKAVIN
jgi:hypothetical protein